MRAVDKQIIPWLCITCQFSCIWRQKLMRDLNFFLCIYNQLPDSFRGLAAKCTKLKKSLTTVPWAKQCPKGTWRERYINYCVVWWLSQLSLRAEMNVVSDSRRWARFITQGVRNNFLSTRRLAASLKYASKEEGFGKETVKKFLVKVHLPLYTRSAPQCALTWPLLPIEGL